ncbi:polysaccharide deacetylase family protein [Haladaptatus pallidirubidus]|uniref:polysaccharide deacetylase family protein n=1 Tax=Haladaptatus pallidirubidus TaxID=1008152 RepID=UPI0035EA08E4
MSRKRASTRRDVLKRTGMAVAGATLVVGTSAAQSANGKLVFTYDDGPVKDYTHAYQRAHREEGVPGCAAVPSASVGTERRLSAEQLRTLEADGWEIMSHSVHHRALGAMSVTEDVAPDDRKLYVESNLHGELEGDQLVVDDGSQSATVTVAGKGSDENGEFLTLDSAVGKSFAASDGVTERYTDEVIRTSLGESRTQLEEYGVTVTNMVMPYGAYGPRTRELAGEYYTAVANGGLAIGGRGQLHRPKDVTLPHLSRAMFRKGKMTETELGAFLDGVADNNALGILGGTAGTNAFHRVASEPRFEWRKTEISTSSRSGTRFRRSASPEAGRREPLGRPERAPREPVRPTTGWRPDDRGRRPTNQPRQLKRGNPDSAG